MGKQQEGAVTRRNLLCIFLLTFLSIGCSAMPCEKLEAKKLRTTAGMLEFRIYRGNDSYWGRFNIYDVDHTVSHSNNSMVKFRSDVSDIEYIRFIYDGSEHGKLTVKWLGEEEVLCISPLKKSYWNEIEKFVANWPEGERRKFQTLQVNQE